MLPSLARRVIETYSERGDLVVDPMCGIGTAPVALGRRTVGVELESRWATLAQTNLDHVHNDPRARSRAEVFVGDARELPRLLTLHAQRLLRPSGRLREGADACLAHGTVDLILTSPPYSCKVADVNPVNGPEPLRRDDTTN